MKQTKLNLFSALLLLIAVGLGQSAQATTKTVTYTMSRVEVNHIDYLRLTVGGDTPFDGVTTVEDQQMTNYTNASFTLPDGFTFTFTWGSGATITWVSSGYFSCSNANVRFQLNWEIPHRYVTNVKVTDDQGTASTLNGGGSATTAFTYIVMRLPSSLICTLKSSFFMPGVRRETRQVRRRRSRRTCARVRNNDPQVAGLGISS